MILARAPLRISFAGGGTDLPAYYERHGGLVLNATITRSVYAMLSPGDYERVQIISSDYRTIHAGRPGPDDDGEELALPWAVVQAMGLERGASIFLASEVPPGTGLGSSSAAAVALIAAIAAFQGTSYSEAQLAELASQVEIVRLGQPIGKQDQYAAAYGGVHVFSFSPGGVTATPVPLSPEVSRGLEAHLALYFTGSTRQARAILQEQRMRSASGDAGTIGALHAMKDQVAPMRAAIEAGDYTTVGALLHETWQMKRRVSSGISTGAIDRAYAAARSAGALGGKITGAGGGGFLLLLAPPDARDAVRAALAPLGLRQMRFALEPRGAHTVVEEDPGVPLSTVPGAGFALASRL